MENTQIVAVLKGPPLVATPIGIAKKYSRLVWPGLANLALVSPGLRGPTCARPRACEQAGDGLAWATSRKVVFLLKKYDFAWLPHPSGSHGAGLCCRPGGKRVFLS